MRTLFLLLLLLAVHFATAQKVWTLENCVAYALENNLQLNDFKFTEQSNRESYRQSVRNLLPNINGFSDYGIRFGRQVDPNDNSIVTTDLFSNNYSISASFDLFQGFQKINGIKASKMLYKAAMEEHVQQKYLLAFSVMRAFYDIQFIEGLILISEEQVGISKTNYELVKKRIEVGLMAGADLYEAESLLLADQLALTQNTNRGKAAKLALIQAMNLEGQNDIQILPDMDHPTPTEPRRLPRIPFLRRP